MDSCVPSTRRSVSGGFSLIEVLVLVAIISVLVALLLPAVQTARAAGARTQCLGRLKQIGAAVQACHDARGTVPSGYVSGVDAAGNDTGPGWGWATRLLPHLEEAALHARIDFQSAIESAAAVLARTVLVPGLLCPADIRPEQAFPIGARSPSGDLPTPTCTVSPANYVGNFGVGEPGVDGDGLFYRNSDVRWRQVTDGLSHTLLVGERSFRHAESTWVGAVSGALQVTAATSPLVFQLNNASNFVLGHTGECYDGPTGPSEINNFSSAHADGVAFVFADGHASMLDATIDYATYKALSTRAGEEVVPRGP